MIKYATILRLLCVVCLLPVAAAAQTPAPDSATVEATRRVLRSELRNFVTAQEMYFSTNSTYAGTMGQTEEVYLSSRGATLVLLTASSTGHSEIAISSAVPGLVCAMFIGDAPRPFGTGREGEPECKGP